MITQEKTVALLSTELDVAAALNIIGHLSIGIGAACRERLIHSDKYLDASGYSHLGVSAWPFIVLKTRPAKLRAALDQARNTPSLVLADYPKQVLTTTTDSELAAEIAATAEVDLEYLGLMVHGAMHDVDAIFGRFALVRHDTVIKI
jgi:hypothetical protein